VNNQEILTKAIQKAAGFDISIPHFSHPLEKYTWEDNKRYWYLGDITIPLFEIIYQHDFAKALWGDKQGFNGVPVEAVLKMAIPQSKSLSDGMKTVESIFSIKSEPIWHYHLQQMVIANDPIAYLAENM
jgi:hypothetical protein